MLASTVQFSNNDQPPITPLENQRVHWGRHRRTTTRPHLQTPNSVPGQHPPDPAFHAPKSSTSSPEPKS
jgi:hypothetical protein